MMIEVLKYVLVIIGSYIIGNFNPALTISKFMHSDVRKLGSGNPGTMNMVRSFGIPFGIITLLLDALKGFVPALLGWFFLGDFMSFEGSRIGIYVGGTAIIVGHIFPCFMKFKGGKGIASTLGIMFAANPIAAAVSLIATTVLFFIIRMSSPLSFLCIYSLIAIEGYRMPGFTETNQIAAVLLLFSIVILTLFAHRKNLLRMVRGEEKRISLSRKKE